VGRFFPHTKTLLSNKKLSEWHALSDNVLFVQESDIAVDAFNMLIEKRVTGLAVVNEVGKLVGSISASDLKVCFVGVCSSGVDLRVVVGS
jgi:CBS domain-containing protein